MDITPTADDKGLQRLKLEQRDKSVKALRPLDAYPRIPSSEQQQPSQPPPHGERRHQEERRQEERRKESGTVTYDTRGQLDRRKKQRRRGRGSRGEPPPHIDELV